MASGQLAGNEGAVSGSWGARSRSGQVRWWKRLQLALPLLVLLSACGMTSDPSSEAAATAEEPRLQRVTAPVGAHLERFGAAAAVAGDVTVVGAWGNSQHGDEAGAAYVYRFDAATASWGLDGGTLSPNEAIPGSRFGHSVAIAADLVAVGAIYDPASGDRAGAVHLFERSAGGWQERAKLLPPENSDGAHFGSAIAIDERTLAVSAAGPADPRIYLFERVDREWQEAVSIAAPPGAEGQYFGGELALAGDVLAVGAPDRDGTGAGSVYLFERSGNGWSQRGPVQGGAGEPMFGTSVALAPGGLLAIGAPAIGDDGAVYLYDLADGDVRHEQVLRPEGSGQPHFGSSVALAKEWVAVGSPGARHESFASGVVQLFRRSDDSSPAWRFAREVAPSRPAHDLAFGISVAASADHLTIGATGDLEGDTISGSINMVPWSVLESGSP